VPTKERTPTLPPPADRLLSFIEAAALVNIQPKTLARWVQQGLFPRPMRLGKRGKVTLRYRKSDLDAFFALEASRAQRPASAKGGRT
jgi:predicted DNA-binding transcriptional regulator AlpA